MTYLEVTREIIKKYEEDVRVSDLTWTASRISSLLKQKEAKGCYAEDMENLLTVSAKKCNKVKHCIAEEWSKIEPTGIRDDICETCLNMVKTARETLRSNMTREELKEVLEGSCALLWFKPAVVLCDKMVDKLIPELVDILSSEMDPETVCSVAKLCNNEAFWNAHKNSKECVHCEAFAESADKQMNSVSLEQFRNGILEVCRTAGSFSDACSQIGTELSGVLHSTTKGILRSKPCEAVSLCPTGSKTEVLDSQLKIKVKRQMCPLCKIVMESVRDKMLRVRSAEQFAEKMATTCERMKLSNNTCSVLSSPSFYEKLKTSDWIPNSFCSLTYCLEKPDEEVPIWPLLPAHIGSFKLGHGLDALELLENVEMFFPPLKKKEVSTPRPTIAFGDPVDTPVFFAPSLYIAEFEDCKTCRAVIDLLLRNRGKEIEAVCDKVQHGEMCKRFLAEFSPILKKAIAEGTLSKKLCRHLIPTCKINQEEASPESCNFCVNVMKVLKHGDSYFWGRALEDKCNDVHEKSQDKCKNLSSLFVSFPSLFKNSTKETEVCSFLKMCRPSSIEQHQPVPTVKTVCEDCMLAVQTLADSLKSNESSELIEELLDSMCSLVPQDKRGKCKELVEIIGVEGLKRIIESFTPDEVCSKVHLCKRKTEVTETPVAPPTEVQGPLEKIPCKFCLMAMKMLTDELQDDKTEAAIRKALDGLCKYFPEETRDTCKNLINEYAEDIIDMVIADFNATEICAYLKICPAKTLIENSISKDGAVFDIDTNELRDWNSIKGGETILEEFSPRIGIVKLEEPKKEDFLRFRQVVEECAMCEALVGVISKDERMLSKEYNFVSHAHLICSIVPAYKMKQCASMVISYGPSIVNLIVNQNADVNDVCVHLDLCDADMQAKVNQPVSVSEDKIKSKESNDCMLGPVFWCANAENAEKCGTFLHCQETVWKSWKSPPTRTNQH